MPESEYPIYGQDNATRPESAPNNDGTALGWLRFADEMSLRNLNEASTAAQIGIGLALLDVKDKLQQLVDMKSREQDIEYGPSA